MCDEVYYYKDRCRELEKANEFVRKNTLLRVEDRLEYIKSERMKNTLPIGGLDYALEVVRSMLKDG